MTDEEYLLLYEKHQANAATPEESARLAAYLATAQLPDLPWDAASMGAEAATQATIWRQLQPHLRPRRSRWRVASLLALLLVGLLAGALGYVRWPRRPLVAVAARPAALPAAPARLTPGRTQALLTLADGSTLLLDQALPGLLARQGGSRVLKTAAGQLRYAAGPGAAALYNTVATPRGGQYQLTLPDGSRVWLNAASSLRFPVAFGEGERRVQLRGEAYFEVAKDAAHPFRVSAGPAEVTVLGTHFNVNAYADEPALTTTLLEGAVRVAQGEQQVLLRPGQQATAGPTSPVRVQAVDAQHAIAWKNGYFIFNDEPIEGIMRQVARWYDVDVQYQGALAGKNFNGTVSRYQDAAAVLHMLELTGAVHFTTQGRRIVVRP